MPYHKLITQWNCDLYDLDWLKRRQKLFERFTLPSIKAQTCKNFEWILVSDSRTPDEFKAVLDSYPATVLYHDFENYIWKTPSLDGLSERMQLSTRLEYIGDIVAAYIGKRNEDYIITSRCDNDDALSIDHIDKIQRHANRLWNVKERRKFWLSLIRGYRWCNDKVYPINSIRSPFVSFIESPEDLKTCYQCCHTIIDRSGYPIEGIREGLGDWLQVVHGENLLNRLKRYRGEMPAKNISGRFIV